jgi:hypothetical protein
MPTFFDEHNLSQDQQARWDTAIKAYADVMESNLQRRIAKMSDDDKRTYLEKAKQNNPEETRTVEQLVRAHYEAFMLMNGGGAGNSKSALFARLLEGKEALPYPPPTSYSYPWYAIIEQDEAFQVSVGGIPTLGGLIKGTGGAKGVKFIGINQCAWAVLQCNAAAEDLFKLQDDLDRRINEREASDEKQSTPVWTTDLIKQVRHTYSANEPPAMRIKHGHWDEFELYTGPSSGSGQRRWLEKDMEDLDAGNTNCVKHTHSVFATEFLKPEARVGRVVKKGQHPREAQREAVEHGRNEFWLNVEFGNIVEDVKRYESYPAGADWVEVEYRGWLLRKVAKQGDTKRG